MEWKNELASDMNMIKEEEKGKFRHQQITLQLETITTVIKSLLDNNNLPTTITDTSICALTNTHTHAYERYKREIYTNNTIARMRLEGGVDCNVIVVVAAWSRRLQDHSIAYNNNLTVT